MDLTIPPRRAAAALQRPCRAVQQVRHGAARLWGAVAVPQRWQQRVAAATAAAAASGPGSAEPEEPEGLLPEEDMQVLGSYRDAMSSNTELGKAVRGACDELDMLGDLERHTLEQAEGLLKQIGFRGSLFKSAEQQQEEGQ